MEMKLLDVQLIERKMVLQSASCRDRLGHAKVGDRRPREVSGSPDLDAAPNGPRFKHVGVRGALGCHLLPSCAPSLPVGLMHYHSTKSSLSKDLLSLILKGSLFPPCQDYRPVESQAPG
jgi:hypothetical protein